MVDSPVPTDPQVSIGRKTVLFFVLKEPLNGFSDFGVRGRLSILIIHKRFALHECFFIRWCETLHAVVLKDS